MGCTIADAVKILQIPRSQINRMVFDGRITLENGMVADDTMQEIRQERETYISVTEIAFLHRSTKFDPGKGADRQNLVNKIRANDHFGLPVTHYQDLLSGTKKDVFFFRRKDLPTLEECLKDFFSDYSVSEEEKIRRILNRTKDHPELKRVLKKYRQDMFYEKPVTSVFTQCVEILTKYPDLPKLTDKALNKMFKEDMMAGTMDILVSFLNYAMRHVSVWYGKISIEKKPGEGMPAYPLETYIGLAECVFDPDHIEKEDLVRKALDDHNNIEIWLYVAIFFVCGWRAQDICRGWKYLRMEEHPELPFEINRETLYEDLLYDRIPYQTYEDVCRYSLGMLDASRQMPSKTSAYDPAVLQIFCTPEMMTFYGMLTLIAECVMIRTGEGYMQDNRTSEYQRLARLKAFFGPKIEDVLEGKNLESRRLNKDFLQGIGETAKNMGKGSIMASMIASLARNHTSPDTITHYIHDHTLSGETAEVVIYEALQRGVFASTAYMTIMNAFPDIFGRLPMKEQTRLMVYADRSLLTAETGQAEIMETMEIREDFNAGEVEKVEESLNLLYQISCGKGKGKDMGVYCTRKVCGKACDRPEFETCLGNACPNLILTRLGIIPLIGIISDYKSKALSGDVKAEAVLKKILLPRFQGILNRFMKEQQMTKTMKTGIKHLLKEGFYADKSGA